MPENVRPDRVARGNAPMVGNITFTVVALHDEEADTLPAITDVPGSIEMSQHLTSNRHPARGGGWSCLSSLPLNHDDQVVGLEEGVMTARSLEHEPGSLALDRVTPQERHRFRYSSWIALGHCQPLGLGMLAALGSLVAWWLYVTDKPLQRANGSW